MAFTAKSPLAHGRSDLKVVRVTGAANPGNLRGICVCVSACSSYEPTGHTRFSIRFVVRVLYIAMLLIPVLLRVVVVVVSHIQRIGCQPEKTTLHRGQSRSWSAEQGKGYY